MQESNTPSPKRTQKKVSAGTIIFQEKEKGDRAYLIQSGEVEIYTLKEKTKNILGKLGAGEIIGEMALFNEGQRTANVEAVTETILIEITQKKLQEKLQNSDVTIRAIVNMMTRRLVEQNKSIEKNPTSIEQLSAQINKRCESFADTLPEGKAKQFNQEITPLIDTLTESLMHYNS
ncbi:MAG: cyclic nucleotide-binding domain-containing protein [Alphaproteobacteria bacterium]|jgi:CRP-like cAMP-binding protein|nr:cyclic nucleotide-binding domain-containing protein [Alphaproteobacteria bacterium]MCB1551194.1 cyclic nucleotide-binding domain-containing protein [Alphaproteobacteria bacterium]MCB9985918.1 cyclic nucleotide-binding domain-containing protein [Micavibrio sp.]HPQ50987.1 cyclic nucleotide-binding domain-containing protein [Alphaproteobacteria bacterium]HRK96928.1 cyclic nucleotide-binding domain-containing protein [Alphaproteobacteria bacterium]